jgi:hypothetical protein
MRYVGSIVGLSAYARVPRCRSRGRAEDGRKDQRRCCPGIHVAILTIRNSIGTVDCALFDSPNGFPRDVLHSGMRLVVTKIPSSTVRCDFEGIPSGIYALVVLDDENMNGKLRYQRAWRSNGGGTPFSACSQ